MPQTAKPGRGLLSKYLSSLGQGPVAPPRNGLVGGYGYSPHATRIGQSPAGSDSQVPCPPVEAGRIGTTSEAANALARPGWQVSAAYGASRKSLAGAIAKFPQREWHDGPGDAWRHFRWNYSMAKTMGAPAAQAFANAHEVSTPNKPAELAMDLHNNAMGRAFGADPRYARLSPDEAADLALRSGCLINWARPAGK